MEYYLIERRRKAQIEDANCFLTTSLSKVVTWIKNNQDFDRRDFHWYWVVIKIKLDDDLGGELFKIFDWDGQELEEQPI